MPILKKKEKEKMGCAKIYQEHCRKCKQMHMSFSWQVNVPSAWASRVLIVRLKTTIKSTDGRMKAKMPR